MRPRCELWLVVGACAAAPAPIANVTHAPPPSAGPPALFAELVRPDATWTFPAETVDVEGPDHRTRTGEVTCTATSQVIAKGWSTDIACSGMDYANLIDGHYVITRDGMWRIDETIEGEPPADTMLIAAIPVPRERKTEHDESGSSFGEAWKAEPHGGGWCISDDSWGGDEGGWALCIQAGKGIVGGSGYFAGGFTHDTYFGDVPRH